MRDIGETRKWTPQQLWEMTPHELLVIFGARPKESGRIDAGERLELLKKHNELMAAKGIRPRAPSWFLPQLRRVKRNG